MGRIVVFLLRVNSYLTHLVVVVFCSLSGWLPEVVRGCFSTPHFNVVAPAGYKPAGTNNTLCHAASS